MMSYRLRAPCAAHFSTPAPDSALRGCAHRAVGAISTPAMRATNFSWLALGYSISSFCGSVIAGLVIDHSRYSSAYAVFCGFALLALTLLASGRLKRVQLNPPVAEKAAG